MITVSYIRGRDAIVIIKNMKFTKVGLILSKDFPVLGAFPDGLVAEEYILEIKCSVTNNNFKKYVKDGVIAKKYYAQMQMQMFFTKKEKCFFCVAHEDFETRRKLIFMKYLLSYPARVTVGVLFFF